MSYQGLLLPNVIRAWQIQYLKIPFNWVHPDTGTDRI